MMMPARILFASLGLIALWPSRAPAGELTGRQIAQNAEKNYRGFGGQRSKAKLIVKDAAGDEKVYRLLHFLLEPQDDTGMRSLIRFLGPESVARTAVLSIEQRDGPDEIWLYLARTNQVMRIEGAERSAPLMGSEIEFEQLTFPSVDKYTHRLAGEAKVDGRRCQRLEQKPKSRTSKYLKLLSCYDLEYEAPIEIRYFDLNGQLSKVLRANEYEQHDGKWRPGRVEVTNVRTKRSTVYAVEEIRVGIQLSPRLFSSVQLRR